MPDYVVDGTTLPGPKVAHDGVSSEVAAPDMWCRHTDYNALRDASNSLREYIRPGGVGFTPGSYPLATLTVGANGNITAIAAGTGLTDGDKGDVVVSGGGTIFTIDSASVTNAKMANMAANTVKANLTGSPAAPTDATVAALTSAVASGLLAGPGNFGSGRAGDVTFDGSSAVTGWTRSGSVYSTTKADWFYRAVTINGGVTLCMEIGGEGTGGGCSGRFFASQGITVPSGTATIKLNGATPSVNVAATNMTTGHTGAVAGQGAGGIQNAGQNVANISANWFTDYRGGVGGFGGPSASNAGSTTAGSVTTIFGDAIGVYNTWSQALTGRLGMSNPAPLAGGCGGGSGGGTTGIASGGAGGNGAGVLIVGIRTKLGAGTLALEAKGGNGGAAQSAVGSNAGGGSGGGGGIIEFGCGTASIPAGVTFNVNGGTGGAPQGTGTAGGTGGTGSKSEYYLGLS